MNPVGHEAEILNSIAVDSKTVTESVLTVNKYIVKRLSTKFKHKSEFKVLTLFNIISVILAFHVPEDYEYCVFSILENIRFKLTQEEIDHRYVF